MEKDRLSSPPLSLSSLSRLWKALGSLLLLGGVLNILSFYLETPDTFFSSSNSIFSSYTSMTQSEDQAKNQLRQTIEGRPKNNAGTEEFEIGLVDERDAVDLIEEQHRRKLTYDLATLFVGIEQHVNVTLLEEAMGDPNEMKLFQTSDYLKQRDLRKKRPDFDIDPYLAQCEDPKLDSVSSLEKLLRQQVIQNTCSAPVSLKEFICSANCDSDEPELYHKMRLYNMEKYRIAEIWKLCKREYISALIWIENNIPKFIPCGERVIGRSLWGPAQKLISLLSCSIKLPNLLFAFDNSDYAIPKGSKSWINPVPGVVRYAGLPSHPAFLFPVAEYVLATTHCNFKTGNQDSYLKLCKAVDAVASVEACALDFNDRADSIYWRGSFTGNSLEEKFVNFNPRFRLVRDFGMREKPGVRGSPVDIKYDIAFSKGPAPPKSLGQAALSIYRESLTNHVKPHTYCQKKYLLHAEGNSFAGSIGFKLTTESTVLFVDSPFGFHEFYYIHLKRWKHFIPIHADLGNLDDVKAFLETPEGLKVAMMISNNVQQLFNNRTGRLRPESTYCYLTRLFYTLNQTQGDEPTYQNMENAGIPVSKFETMSYYKTMVGS